MSVKSFLSRLINARPVPYSESLTLNRLGYHVLRIAFFRTYQTLRPVRTPAAPPYAAYLARLKRDGVVIIPNFFPEGTHQAIRTAFATLGEAFTPDPTEVGLPHVDRVALFDARVQKSIREAFTENECIRQVTEAYLHSHFNLPMQAALTKIYCSQEELDKPMNGGTNNLHFDAPLRVVKAFYYVSDTTVENGAFTYCLGSNKRGSLKRLWLEYLLSIRFAGNKGNKDHHGEYPDEVPWVKVSPEEMRRYGLTETPMVGKANTLILADTGGFHRRGTFRRAGMRETVEVNYRNIENVHNQIYPLKRKRQPVLSPALGQTELVRA